VAAELSAGGELRRLLREDALEPERQAVPDLPLGRRLAPTRVDLRERVVEGPAPRGSGGENLGRVLVLVEEGLAGPGRGLSRGGRQAVHRRWRKCRLLDRL
jgi:hypothetical protein